MTEHLLRLTDADLRELINALKSQRLEAPFSRRAFNGLSPAPMKMKWRLNCGFSRIRAFPPINWLPY